jgi:hypothetical protein
MCKFLAGNDLSQMIRKVVSGKDARCAVAFWGQGAVRELFGTDVLERNDVHVVCDLSMGGSNPATLRALGAPNNPKIKYLDGLHAKVFLSEHGAVVGSANASNNGIGFLGEDAQLLEGGSFFTKESNAWQSITAWLDGILKNGSKQVDNKALNTAQCIWNSRNRSRHTFTKKTSTKSKKFLEYNPDTDGLVVVLWRNWLGTTPTGCDINSLANEAAWHNLAKEDIDLQDHWIADFPIDEITAKKVEVANRLNFFYANDYMICNSFEPDYPVVFFENSHKHTPPPPFDFTEKNFQISFWKVIKQKQYINLRDAPAHGNWLAQDHVDLMHRFWQDVKIEYSQPRDPI